MAVSLPYLPSNKNLPLLFDKIASAKIPDSFGYKFLQETIGLKGSNDRALITLLRNLAFIDQSNAPTASYRKLKGEDRKVAVAEGIRTAYAPLFDSDQDAHKLSGDRLKGLIAQVAGTDDTMTARIAGTFGVLAKIADFTSRSSEHGEPITTEGVSEEVGLQNSEASNSSMKRSSSLRPEFHYNIQVHLPANSTEEVYLSIFNALRKTFQ